MPWSGEAACAKPPYSEWNWWPSKDRQPSKLLPLLELCAECPAREPCLKFALETRSSGVYGSTTDQDRSGLLDLDDPNPPKKADVALAVNLLEEDHDRRLEELREIVATWPESLERWRRAQRRGTRRGKPKRVKPVLEAKCARCQQTFTTTKAPPPMFCSRRCQAAAFEFTRPRKAPPERQVCVFCGETFTPRQLNRLQKFCSIACVYAARRASRRASRAPRACVECGTVFEPGSAQAKVCSYRCAGLRSARMRREASLTHPRPKRPVERLTRRPSRGSGAGRIYRSAGTPLGSERADLAGDPLSGDQRLSSPVDNGGAPLSIECGRTPHP
jgi:hypothetical protein